MYKYLVTFDKEKYETGSIELRISTGNYRYVSLLVCLELGSQQEKSCFSTMLIKKDWAGVTLHFCNVAKNVFLCDDSQQFSVVHSQDLAATELFEHFHDDFNGHVDHNTRLKKQIQKQ